MARIGIKDIAARAGVSPATVSRVLNNRAGTMTEETRRRVQRVIEETGYRPSNAARSLRLDRSATLGVVLADIRNPFSSAMLEALTSQAAGRGYSMMTATSANSSTVETESIRRLMAAGVDGLIINTCGGAQDALSSESVQLPTVLLDRDVPGSGLPLVTSNNAELIKALIDELVRAGCERCYLLDDIDNSSSIRRERGRAFVDQLDCRAIDGEVVPLPSLAKDAARVVNDLVADGSGPASIVAVNGLVFLRLIEALQLLGLDVPGDVRVATFDEYAWNHVLFGGITTAMQNTSGMATAILDQLIEAMQGGTQSPLHTEVPGTIIARASTR